MRILIHTQYYPPEMGAPQARLSDLAKRLKHLGHEVQVLTALPNYPTGKIFRGYHDHYVGEDFDGISVHRSWILPSKRRSLFPRLMSYLSFTLSSFVAGLLRVRKIDIIFTESPPLFLGVSGWLLATMKGARWILNVSDLWPDSARHIGMFPERSLTYRLLRKMAHFFYRRAWLVTGQSQEIITEIQQQVPSARTHHLSNGVDPKLFHPQKKTDEIRRHYLKNGEIGFVYAGLHGLFQGLDQILSVAFQLKDEPVRFVFLGDGPEKETLLKRTHDLDLGNVDFYPPISHGQVSSILASMDVAVVPLKSSIQGAVPSKIYEAMASGIPILLVANGEAKDIVNHAKAGIVVAPGDIDRLALAVRELVSLSERRAEMGRSGRIAAENLYDRSMIAERFHLLLQERQ